MFRDNKNYLRISNYLQPITNVSAWKKYRIQCTRLKQLYLHFANDKRLLLNSGLPIQSDELFQLINILEKYFNTPMDQITEAIADQDYAAVAKIIAKITMTSANPVTACKRNDKLTVISLKQTNLPQGKIIKCDPLDINERSLKIFAVLLNNDLGEMPLFPDTLQLQGQVSP